MSVTPSIPSYPTMMQASMLTPTQQVASSNTSPMVRPVPPSYSSVSSQPLSMPYGQLMSPGVASLPYMQQSNFPTSGSRFPTSGSVAMPLHAQQQQPSTSQKQHNTPGGQSSHPGASIGDTARPAAAAADPAPVQPSSVPRPTPMTPLGQAAKLSHQSPQLAYTSMMSPQPQQVLSQYSTAVSISTHQVPNTSSAPTPSLKMHPVVPQPGSYPTAAAYPSPSPSPFQPISPAPVSLEIGAKQRPGSIDLERRSSLDDMLTAEVEINTAETPTVEVLQPKVMTPGEIEEQKLEAQAKKDIAKATAKDPYDSDEILSNLLQQMEALETQSRDRVLFDAMWRELNVKVENDAKKTISIARCYPMKNRSPEVLPFDTNR